MAVSEQAIRADQLRERGRVRVKTIALPAEHGGWGLLFEPIVLALLLAPSIAGLYLAVGAVGFFLARHPLTLLMLNRRRESSRTALAKRFAALYLLVGSVSFVAAIVFAGNSFILPLLIAAPLAMVQLGYDWSGRRRVLVPELAGAIAISSLAAAIALSGGWRSGLAFALWAIVIARAVPAILYVRAILARLHRRTTSAVPALFAHALAIIAVAVFARGGWMPKTAVAAMLILFLRAAVAFAIQGRRRMTAKQLGFSELAFGTLTVFLVVMGNAFGW